jgi:hypothetical protein
MIFARILAVQCEAATDYGTDCAGPLRGRLKAIGYLVVSDFSPLYLGTSALAQQAGAFLLL